MLDRSKILEYFNADELVKGNVNVVGCGAIGSHIAEQLARIGVSKIHLWDFDTVESKNIANQMFFADQINMAKVDAVEDTVKRINPDIAVVKHGKGLHAPYVLSGYVFLCVDSIGLRREIVEANRFNPSVKAFFDFRMRLTDAQTYYADRTNEEEMNFLLGSMNFTSEEAKAATPQSACGVELSVIYTVKGITSIGISNFCKFCLGEKPKNLVNLDYSNVIVNCI